jgi:hypothetical protein
MNVASTAKVRNAYRILEGKFLPELRNYRSKIEEKIDISWVVGKQFVRIRGVLANISIW